MYLHGRIYKMKNKWNTEGKFFTTYVRDIELIFMISKEIARTRKIQTISREEIVAWYEKVITKKINGQ